VFTNKNCNIINDTNEMYADNSEITGVDDTYSSGNDTYDASNTVVGAYSTRNTGIGSDTTVGELTNNNNK